MGNPGYAVLHANSCFLNAKCFNDGVVRSDVFVFLHAQKRRLDFSG